MAELANFASLFRHDVTISDPFAQYLLGKHYYDMVPRKYKEALDLFASSAKHCCVPAQEMMARIYLDDNNDYEHALHWAQLAANQGGASGQYIVGHMYYHGYGVEKDYKQALHWLKMAAEQNQYEALYLLGVMYKDGLGVVQDYVQAYKYFDIATDQFPHAKALNCMADMAYNGHGGVDKNIVEAIEFYFNAADSGDSDAQFNIGLIYYRGDGPDGKDYGKALQFFMQAADNDHTDAQAYLGQIYHDGVVLKDLTKSLEFTRMAANKGNAMAQNMLGTHYYNTNAMTEAFKWYEKSANQNDPVGLKNLGDMYRLAEGTKFDPEIALTCYLKAATLGNELAKEHIFTMLSHLGTAGINYICGIMTDKQVLETKMNMLEREITKYKAALGTESKAEVLGDNATDRTLLVNASTSTSSTSTISTSATLTTSASSSTSATTVSGPVTTTTSANANDGSKHPLQSYLTVIPIPPDTLTILPCLSAITSLAVNSPNTINTINTASPRSDLEDFEHV